MTYTEEFCIITIIFTINGVNVIAWGTSFTSMTYTEEFCIITIIIISNGVNVIAWVPPSCQ